MKCIKAGPAKESSEIFSEALPAALEWGEVLITLQLAPINPADLYTARTGGIYGDKQSTVPFVAGHDGVGVVTEVIQHCLHIACHCHLARNMADVFTQAIPTLLRCCASEDVAK